MNRLAEYTVASGLSIAWRLAPCPTSRWPSSVNATTDGVTRPPSALGITSAWPPSIVAATTQFVGATSMPTPLAMPAPLGRCALLDLSLGRWRSASSNCSPGYVLGPGVRRPSVKAASEVQPAKERPWLYPYDVPPVSRP